MSRDDSFSNRPAWLATLVYPWVLLVLFVDHQYFGPGAGESLLGFTFSVANGSLLAELTGLLVAACTAAVVGPHLALVLGLGLLTVGQVGLTSAGLYGEPLQWAITALYMFSFATGLGAMGSSTGGGAPGLRYAAAFLTWAAWVMAPQLARLVTASAGGFTMYVSAGAMALATLAALIVGVHWWVAKRHPRPPRADATFRTAGITGVAFAIIAAVYTADVMRTGMIIIEPPLGVHLGSLPYLAHLAAAVSTALLLAVVALGLQLVRSPARMGVLTGLGCLMVSLASLWVWTSEGSWLMTAGILAGIGQALLLPWTWARATSDAHWRAATALAAVVLFAPHATDVMTELWAVVALTALAFAAIPIGALGWFGDDWVFGDVPGSSLDRRGR